MPASGPNEAVGVFPPLSQSINDTGLTEQLTGKGGDPELVIRARDGDDDAFAELVKKHKRRVFALAGRFAKDDGELDDLCQDIFIKAYRKLAQYRGDAPFEHWLSRIATNVCYDTLRRRVRRPEGVPLETVEHLLKSRDDTDGQQAAAALYAAMERLKADERLVLVLLELEEQSVKEVAKATGWSESNVKTRAHRARQALRKILEIDHG